MFCWKLQSGCSLWLSGFYVPEFKRAMLPSANQYANIFMLSLQRENWVTFTDERRWMLSERDVRYTATREIKALRIPIEYPKALLNTASCYSNALFFSQTLFLWKKNQNLNKLTSLFFSWKNWEINLISITIGNFPIWKETLNIKRM